MPYGFPFIQPTIRPRTYQIKLPYIIARSLQLHLNNSHIRTCKNHLKCSNKNAEFHNKILAGIPLQFHCNIYYRQANSIYIFSPLRYLHTNPSEAISFVFSSIFCIFYYQPTSLASHCVQHCTTLECYHRITLYESVPIPIFI